MALLELSRKYGNPHCFRHAAQSARGELTAVFAGPVSVRDQNSLDTREQSGELRC